MGAKVGVEVGMGAWWRGRGNRGRYFIRLIWVLVVEVEVDMEGDVEDCLQGAGAVIAGLWGSLMGG